MKQFASVILTFGGAGLALWSMALFLAWPPRGAPDYVTVIYQVVTPTALLFLATAGIGLIAAGFAIAVSVRPKPPKAGPAA